MVTALKAVQARHVIVATVPSVTIAPIARGWRGKSARGSRYFPYYVRPWIDDDDFDVDRDDHLTEQEARTIDSAIDAYNATIIDSVRAARQEGRDWYVFDLGALLDSLATKRYLEDPSARPPWWEPYTLPAELAALQPVPSTRFFESGRGGRTEGGLFSLDGVHATTIGYGVIAREVMRIMNEHARVEFRTPTGDRATAEHRRRRLHARPALRHADQPTAARDLVDAGTDGLARRDRRLGQPAAAVPLTDASI